MQSNLAVLVCFIPETLEDVDEVRVVGCHVGGAVEVAVCRAVGGPFRRGSNVSAPSDTRCEESVTSGWRCQGQPRTCRGCPNCVRTPGEYSTESGGPWTVIPAAQTSASSNAAAAAQYSGQGRWAMGR